MSQKWVEMLLLPFSYFASSNEEEKRQREVRAGCLPCRWEVGGGRVRTACGRLQECFRVSDGPDLCLEQVTTIFGLMHRS